MLNRKSHFFFFFFSKKKKVFCWSLWKCENGAHTNEANCKLEKINHCLVCSNSKTKFSWE